jgi:hypothetical protein
MGVGGGRELRVCPLVGCSDWVRGDSCQWQAATGSGWLQPTGGLTEAVAWGIGQVREASRGGVTWQWQWDGVFRGAAGQRGILWQGGAG